MTFTFNINHYLLSYIFIAIVFESFNYLYQFNQLIKKVEADPTLSIFFKIVSNTETWKKNKSKFILPFILAIIIVIIFSAPILFPFTIFWFIIELFTKKTKEKGEENISEKQESNEEENQTENLYMAPQTDAINDENISEPIPAKTIAFVKRSRLDFLVGEYVSPDYYTTINGVMVEGSKTSQQNAALSYYHKIIEKNGVLETEEILESKEI